MLHLSHLAILTFLPTLLSATPLPTPNPIPLPGIPFISPLDMSILDSTDQLLKRDLGNSSPGVGAVAVVVIVFLAILGFVFLRRNALKRAAMRKKLGIPPQSQDVFVLGRPAGSGQGRRQGENVVMMPMGLTGMTRAVRPQQQQRAQDRRAPVYREQDLEGSGEAPPPAYHEAIGANEAPTRMDPVYLADRRM